LIPFARIAAAILAFAAAPAAAQGDCPLNAFVGDPVLAAAREALLVPGKPVDFAAQPPELRARLQAAGKAAADQAKVDWANLCRYRAANAEALRAGARPRVVFIGASIVEFWQHGDPALFGPGVVNRGIAGQTSAQALLRFYADVVSLRPAAVHILVGTNDVAGNAGPVSDESYIDNIRAMIDVAQANRMRVVLGSIPPAKSFPWRPDLEPAERIRGLNARLKALADERRAEFVDYHAVLADPQGGLRADLANDGVHPNRLGYRAMRPLVERAIGRATSR